MTLPKAVDRLPSLPEVHRSIAVPDSSRGFWRGANDRDFVRKP
jgi:hypothetical protein